MGLFDLFKSNGDGIVVKQGTSKGPGKPKVDITVGDIKQGKVVDKNGYTSDVVLFLRVSKVKKARIS
tara:strand:- start:369 stop:569 length:201 start_codon:yes stop_codon:yes gene_type:complete